MWDFFACDSDLPDYDVIDRYRLLAIGASESRPAPNETIQLRALVSEPDTTTYSWQWCPFSAGADRSYECLLPFSELPNSTSWPTYDLGTEAEPTLSFNISSAIVDELCQAISLLPIPDGRVAVDCRIGLPIIVRLVVQSEGTEIIGIKNLIIRTNSEVQHRNANPRITDLEVLLGGQAQQLSNLAVENEYDMVLDIADDQSETYFNFDDGQDVREELTVTWFKTAGESDSSRTTFLPDDDVDFGNLRNNTYKLATADRPEDGQVRFFLVIRDDRDGVDWIILDATVSGGENE